jgi:lipopolysaccharide transport system permease protein
MMRSFTVLLWSSLKVVRHLVTAGVLNRWRESRFGPLWVLFNPFSSLLIYWFIFKNFMGRGDKLYLSYLCVGLLLWHMLKTALDIGISTLPYKIQALKNFSFRPLLFNISWVIEYYGYYLTAMVLLIGISFFNPFLDLTWQGFILSLPAQMIWLVATSALVHLLSLLNVILRDVKFIVDFAFRLLFLMTPILYRSESISTLSMVNEWNPLYYLMRPFYLSYDLIEGDYFTALVQSFCVAFIILIFSMVAEFKIGRKVYQYEH